MTFGIVWKLPDESTDKTKLRCKKCGVINERRKWINQKWFIPACPKCGVSMRSTIWTGQKPNYELVRRKRQRGKPKRR